MPHDPRKVATAFSRAAISYDTHARIQRLALARCAELLARHLPADASVLDIGCGTGALARLLPGRNWKVTGLDLAHPMCRQAALAMPVVNACAEALPLTSAAFDGAICSLVLQWVNQPQQAVREMARVVKPGGFCGVVALGPNTLCELKQAFTAIDTHRHVNHFATARHIDSLLEAEGFRVSEAQTEATLLEYASVRELMRELKQIGANHVPDRRRGLVTPAMLARMEAAYPRQPSGIVATWDLIYRIVERQV